MVWLMPLWKALCAAQIQLEHVQQTAYVQQHLALCVGCVYF